MPNQNTHHTQHERPPSENHSVNRLTAALGIQPNEILPTFLLFAQASFLGIILIFFFTAANALFLVEFGGEGIPYVYIVASGIVTIVGLLFARLEKSISFSRLLAGTLILLLISVLALRLGLWLSPAPWIIFIVMVWFRLLWVLTNLVLWTLAGRLLNVRQAKRLFPLIMVGAILTMITGGLFATPLVTLLGTTNLLLLAAGGLAGALFFLQLTFRRFPEQVSHVPKTDKNKGHLLPSLLQNRYLLLIVLYAVFSTLATYVLDFIFVSQAEARYSDVNVLAGFFGNFMGLNTFLVLLLSLISAPIFNRYGLKVGLLSNSFFVAGGATAAAIIGTLSGNLESLFWLIVVTKILDDTLVTAMTNNSIRILFQPLPTAQQVPVQTAIESIITPLSIGVVGVMLVLFGLFENFSILHAIYLLLAILATWIVIGVLLNREYLVALKQALTKRHLGHGEPITVDRESIELLKQGLSSPHVGVTIYALHMLEENEPEIMQSHLPELLSHPAPEVRREVLHRIEQLQLSTTLPAIKARIKEEKSPFVKGALLRVLAALGDGQQLKGIYRHLDNPDPEVRQQTMIGLLRSPEIDAVVTASQRLTKLIQAPDPAKRVFAAQVLGEGNLPLVAPLLKLLKDDEIDVQRAALTAAGKVKHSELWPLVIKRLTTPKVRAPAMLALVAGGDAVLVQIQSTFLENPPYLLKEGKEQDMLIRLTQVCGRIGGTQAIALLEKQINIPNEQFRIHILEALHQCGYQAPEEKRPVITQAIKNDMAHITWILSILSTLDAQDTLLTTALTNHLNSYHSRLFLWLSFLYEPSLIQQVQDNLPHPDKKAYAIELLDTLLPTDLSTRLIPFLDKNTAALTHLNAHFPQPNRERHEHLHQLITRANKRLDLWTQACALYTIRDADITLDITKAITDALSSPNPLISETAHRTLTKLDARSHPHDGENPMLSMIEKIIALKGSTFFAKTKESVLTEVATMLQEIELQAGDILFKKGELGDCMYIVHSGELRLHDGERTFEHLGAGGAFGELALLDPAPRSGQATAVSDTLLLRLDADPFYELIADHSEVARAIMEVLVRRLRRW